MLPALIVAGHRWMGIGGWLVRPQPDPRVGGGLSTRTGPAAPGDLFFDQRIRIPDGRVMTWDEMYALVPQPEDGSDWPPAGYTFVSLVVPGTRYRFVELREVGALAGGSLVALGIAGFTVRRRRPGVRAVSGAP